MILDAAHNPAGAATLAAYLAETFAEKPPLVFAAMIDKDVRGMFEALLPAVSALVVTRSSTARSADPETLAQQARLGRAAACRSASSRFAPTPWPPHGRSRRASSWPDRFSCSATS